MKKVVVLLICLFFICSASIAQEFQLKFETEQDTSISYLYRNVFSVSCLDYDGDGVLEIITEIHKWQQSIEIIRAYDSITHELKWEYTFDVYDPEYNFYGFYDFNGDGVKEAVLEWYDKVNEEKIIEIVNPRNNTKEFVLKGFDFHQALDIDNDGFEDLIVSLSDYPQQQPSQYQIWGIFKATKVNSNPNPTAFKLSQNYPNPFNPTTSIQYSVQTTGNVQLTIYNNAGQLIRKLVEEQKLAGEYTIQWNGKDDNGLDVSTGIYFYKLQVGDFVSSKKMIMLK